MAQKSERPNLLRIMEYFIYNDNKISLLSPLFLRGQNRMRYDDSLEQDVSFCLLDNCQDIVISLEQDALLPLIRR